MSVITYTLLVVGVVCWLIYGIAIKDIPVIVANACTFVFVFIIYIIMIIDRIKTRLKK